MFCGIDPGISGAIAFVDKLGALAHVEKLPLKTKGSGKVQLINVKAVGELHRKYGTLVTALEDVGGRSGEGSSSNNKFTKAIGAVYGVSDFLNEVVWVTPQVWKKHFGLSKDKEEARQLAIKRFPAWEAEFTPKRNVQRLKECQDKAEAALIALHYWETKGRLLTDLTEGVMLDSAQQLNV